ncbi:MAG TPA: NrsF family protein [Candidatus Acidoferrales bacterium]|nr:NrsF family protein [Candidatus Acidoferrales bacterium]
MNGGDPEDILNRAARAPHEADPALLARIAASINSGLEPVRPLPAPWVLASGLLAIWAAVALAGAAAFGLYGIARLSGAEIAAIFPLLAAFAWAAAARIVAETIPGSPRPVPSVFLAGGGILALLTVFGLLFHDYRTERFVPQGLVCLETGVVHAAIAALGGWVVLRRGLAVEPVSAGLVAGTLAGLAGIAMLELHCPNLEALHVMVWHTAVIPVSAGAGALFGRLRSIWK